jgi:hypothetical protein
MERFEVKSRAISILHEGHALTLPLRPEAWKGTNRFKHCHAADGQFRARH